MSWLCGRAMPDSLDSLQLGISDAFGRLDFIRKYKHKIERVARNKEALPDDGVN
jgi:hypothetical protein